MQWTSDAPTEAGWYWCKRHPTSSPEMMLISSRVIVRLDHDSPLLWYGPILPPS